MRFSSKMCKCILTFVLTLIILTGCTQQQIDEISDLIAAEIISNVADENTDTSSQSTFTSIPKYHGIAADDINEGQPYFTNDDFTTTAYESYSNLDSLHRPGVAMACLGIETMPLENEERGEIGMVKPVGWHTVKYPDIISDLYLYNRCHLIGWQLSAENANEQNLITGTRYLNIEGMLPYENQVATYIRQTNNHVLYRVTPIYENDDLLCRGVLIEALSMEDDDICFCVFCHNVQPGITIDYTTGESYKKG